MDARDSLSLSDDEEREFKTAILRASSSAWDAPAARWFERWAAFVTQIEQGYDDCLADYRNSLDGRSILARAVHEMRGDLREKVEAALRPLDARFAAASIEMSFPLSTPNNSGWWSRGIPRRMGEELWADLVSEQIFQEDDFDNLGFERLSSPSG